ncbi:MAG: HEAT repeat domain-containing protein, partial [Nostoc sp.]
LKDENTTVQKIAISAIWEIANPAAIPALIECLSSTDADIRTEAASALNELITQAELLLLLDKLPSNDVNIQLNILVLLRKIHDIQSLPDILPFLESQNPELREV